MTSQHLYRGHPEEPEQMGSVQNQNILTPDAHPEGDNRTLMFKDSSAEEKPQKWENPTWPSEARWIKLEFQH